MRYLSFLFFACFSVLSFSQTEDEIIWQEGELLVWNDFQGKQWAGATMQAVTAAGPSSIISGEQSNGIVTVHLTLNTVFSKTQSWTVNTSSDELLAHEQLHFDIAELYTRKMRKALQEYKFTNDFQNELDKVTDDVIAKRKAYQELYDEETNHSNNEEAQLEWNQKIKDELAQLADYQEPSFSVSFKSK